MTTTYFASGSNNPAEIRGFTRIGHAFGVTAPKVTKPGEAALKATAGTGVESFVDSGAFSEVEPNVPHKCDKKCKKAGSDCPGAGTLPFPSYPPYYMVVVDPMTHAKFTKVLALYTRLAVALGNQVYLVVPDCVGHQDVTQIRQAKYAGAIRQLRALGANLLVPMQKGEMTQVEFAEVTDEVLGFTDWIPSFPCNKAPTSPEELAAFIEARNPPVVHLLGIGPRRKAFAKYVAAAGGARVLHDSCLITETVGKSNGRKNHCDETFKGPRVYTKAQTIAQELLDQGIPGETHVKELGIVLAFTPLPPGTDRWAAIETGWAA